VRDGWIGGGGGCSGTEAAGIPGPAPDSLHPAALRRAQIYFILEHDSLDISPEVRCHTDIKKKKKYKWYKKK